MTGFHVNKAEKKILLVVDVPEGAFKINSSFNINHV